MGSGASKRSKPTLYVGFMCPACRAVLMAASEAGIELDKKQLDLGKKEHMTEEFAKINPDRAVPAMDDNGFTLWESRAIMAYLVDTYAPGHAIYPRDPQKRAVINRLLYVDASWAFRTVVTFVVPQAKHGSPPDENKRLELEKLMEYIEKTLDEDKFMNGTSQLTLADFSFAATLSMLTLIDYELEARWPKVTKWIRKMKELPYYDQINPMDEIKIMMRTSEH